VVVEGLDYCLATQKLNNFVFNGTLTGTPGEALVYLATTPFTGKALPI